MVDSPGFELQEEAAARFTSFIDRLPQGIIVIDGAGFIRLVNEPTLQMFGYTRDELTGEPIERLVPERFHGAHVGYRSRFVAEDHARAMAPGRDLAGRRKDGSEFPVELSISAGDTPNGRIGMAVVQDVTARREMEVALRASEERYRDLLENASDIVYTHDLQGNLTFVNAAGRRAYGYNDEEVADLNVRDIIDPDYVNIAVEMTLKRVRGEIDGNGQPYELLTRARDGAPVWVEVSARLLRDADGNPAGVHGIARDVTARREAEAALHESQQRYRQIFEHHSAIRLLVDPETQTIVEPNEAACDFYGYTREELTGMAASRINTATPEHIAAEMAVAAAERRTTFSFQHRLASGEIRDVQIFSGPVDIGGKRLLFSIIYDVTERRRAERLLASQRQLLEMVALGRPLTEVLDNLARAIEASLPGAICAVLAVNEDATALTHASAPSLPPEYADATRAIPIGPNVGACGTAAYRKARVVAVDIATDPLWADYRDLGVQFGVTSCWSTPILSSAGNVLGTFAVYYRERHEPGEAEFASTEMAAHIAGIAIERKWHEEAILSRAAELETSRAQLEEQSVQLQRALDSERERARRDPLTGALNHAAIADELRRRIDDPSTESLALAMVDVDGLKAANDTYGHQIGDTVLAAVAAALARDGAIVGRYGGDEFVAVLVGADRDAAERYRDAVVGALTEAELFDAESGARIKIVASVGLAIYPEEADEVEGLIRLSDSAMYASRRQRAAQTETSALTRMLGGDRAARMIGEIVPFLTSPGSLSEKLSLVAKRVSIGAGYDAVNFVLWRNTPSERNSNTYGENASLVTAWDQLPRDFEAPHPMRELLRRTHRPVIVDDLAISELIEEPQRQVLLSGGLRSGLSAPMIWQGEVVGSLSVASKQPSAFGPRDAQFLGAVATQVTSIVRTSAMVDELQEASSQLLQAHHETVMMLAGAAEAHDQQTGVHLVRVRDIAQALALELGYEEEMAKEIGFAAVLHDIGKIRVPDYVLTSSASLSDSEWTLMKRHTAWGADFLGARPGFELASQVARSHHERWDGSGYPDGLAGEEIPEAAAITSVADSLDAMTNDRPYRSARPLADAIAEIQAWSERQFNPRVVEALVRLYKRGAIPCMDHDDDREAAA